MHIVRGDFLKFLSTVSYRSTFFLLLFIFFSCIPALEKKQKVDAGDAFMPDENFDSCTPYCTDKECGDDGCGGSCGECNKDTECQKGKCIQWYDNGDDTITDKKTKYMWQKGTAPSAKNHEDAKKYCSDECKAGGHTDWRLPTIDELRTTIIGCPQTMPDGKCPATDTCGCKNTSDCFGCNYMSGPGTVEGCYFPSVLEGSCSWYWSSSIYSPNVAQAWYVDFTDGSVDNYDKENIYYVRCVHAGQ
jgi:hypothetical protein